MGGQFLVRVALLEANGFPEAVRATEKSLYSEPGYAPIGRETFRLYGRGEKNHHTASHRGNAVVRLYTSFWRA